MRIFALFVLACSEPAPKPCIGRATIIYNERTEPVRIERDRDCDGKIDVIEEP